MTIKKAYHVVVIGGGITGLSTAFHLKRRGISQIALAQGETLGSPSRLASGFCSGGHLDNFTRLSHLHGSNLANDLWTFGDKAFDSLGSYAKEHNTSFRAGHRFRLLASKPEIAEAHEATRQLSALSLQGALSSPRPEGLCERILGVQDDGPRSAFVDSEQLFQALSNGTSNIHRIPRITTIVRGPDSITLILSNGMSIRTEVVVVAAHLNTGVLVPELAPALVPFVDQWSEFTFEKPLLPQWCPPGTTFTTNHTHEWGVIVEKTKMRFGGGRYLRPLGGTECSHAHVDAKIIRHLEKQLTRTFSSVTTGTFLVASTYGMVDIKPCDELPIIGPMFGEPRLLIATGFGGQGLQMGFYAGAQIANLIAYGSAPDLPRMLWPERLRALPEHI